MMTSLGFTPMFKRVEPSKDPALVFAKAPRERTSKSSLLTECDSAMADAINSESLCGCCNGGRTSNSSEAANTIRPVMTATMPARIDRDAAVRTSSDGPAGCACSAAAVIAVRCESLSDGAGSCARDSVSSPAVSRIDSRADRVWGDCSIRCSIAARSASSSSPRA